MTLEELKSPTALTAAAVLLLGAAIGLCYFFGVILGPLALLLSAFLLVWSFMRLGVGESVLEAGFAAAVVAVGLFPASKAWDDFRFRRQGRVVEAEVTAWDTSRSSKHTTYRVRYAFSVPERPGRFTHASTFPFLEEDLWVELPREAWEESKLSRKLRVRYLPSDPRKSRPD